MALLTFASAKGSPGVTTAALLVGALWPRQSVVVEADPSGGDVALRMPGAGGQPLDPQVGLASLVAAGRKSLYPALVDQHAQSIVGGQRVLAGLAGSEQASGISQWDQLGELFAELPGADVIADLGRIGATTPQNALLNASTATVLFVDAVPSNVLHLRERLVRLRERFGRIAGPSLHVVVVAPIKRARAVRETADMLEQAEIEVAGVHHLAQDHKGAMFFLGQVSGSPSRTSLVRSVRPIVDVLSKEAEPRFVPLEPEETSDEAEADLDEEVSS